MLLLHKAAPTTPNAVVRMQNNADVEPSPLAAHCRMSAFVQSNYFSYSTNKSLYLSVCMAVVVKLDK